jgi:hypothetical protein
MCNGVQRRTALTALVNLSQDYISRDLPAAGAATRIMDYIREASRRVADIL